MSFSYYFLHQLDKKVKLQAKEIERQQLVISLQQVEIDSHKIDQTDLKMIKDLR
jgi:hypothetical protein